MKKANKLLSTVVVSSALLTTVAVATSYSANNMKNINNVDMQLGITANTGGKSAKLSVHNVSMTNAFDLNVKIEGNVEFKNIEFTDYIKQNAKTKVNYNESSKVLNIVVTSNVDLAKGGILEIGTIMVDGANSVEYKILDNSQGITILTPTYDEISDNDLQEIGDTKITIDATVQPPSNEDNTTTPPSTPSTPETPSTPSTPEMPEISTVTFNDINNHWAKDTILSFVNKGYINGYGDSTFKPDNSITRAEFIKIVNRVFGYTIQKTENFSDVNPGDWYYNDICRAVRAGYISGYPNGTFKPNEKITREEVATIITNIKACKDTNIDKLKKFKDYDKVSAWAQSSVEGAVEKGYMKGDTDNNFRPTDYMTRAEVVTALSRIK